MIYIYTKFHMSSSNGSLVIAIKPKAKCIFRVTSMLSYILEKTLTNTA